MECTINGSLDHNSDVWNLKILKLCHSLAKTTVQWDPLASPAPHPPPSAGRTQGILFEALTCLLCVLCPEGCWPTDHPRRRAGPDVEGAESPNRSV